MEKKHMFDNPANVKRLLTVFFSTVVILLIVDGVYLLLVKNISFMHT
jgi:hypothetical protein